MRTLILGLLFALAGTGCASTESRSSAEAYDPFENANRAIFRFNRQADRYVLRPIASGYHRITPDPLERSISKFLLNLSSPIVVVSDLLQGKFNQAASDTGRFLVNSTIGVFGFLDPATHLGLPYHEENLGQAFGTWGIGQGPYLVVPIFGPFTLRDGAGRILELPLELIWHIDDNNVQLGLTLMYYLDKRTRLLAGDEALASAIDPYVFLRDAYMQRGRYLLYDGEPPPIDDGFEDEYSEEDFLRGD
ncbi:MAG: VacJ family lipoprotein [Candidatus Rariloculaceae bacterium]